MLYYSLLEVAENSNPPCFGGMEIACVYLLKNLL